MTSDSVSTVRYHMRFIWLICLVAAMGGLLFGYDWVVIGGAKPFYEPYFHIGEDTPFLRGWAQSSALAGCLIGAILSGMLTDRYGRRRLLILSGLLFSLSAVGTGLAWSFTWFILFRILGGLGIGLASNLSPMYIAEMAPARMRGRFVSINQLTIVIGILLAQIVNWQIADKVPSADQIRLLITSPEQVAANPEALDAATVEALAEARVLADPEALERVRRDCGDIDWRRAVDDAELTVKKAEDARIMEVYLLATWNGQRGWRWMFAAETILAFAFFVLMFLVPESPRWLVKYGRDEQAGRILARVGGRPYADNEIRDIKATLAGDQIARVNFRDLLEPKVKKIIALGVFLAVFQQWCGINVIFNYAQEVFSQAGYGVSDILFGIVITGIVNLLFTFVAIHSVDRFGRRILMLIGAGGLAGIYAVLGLGYFLASTGAHMLILVVLAIACYAMSLAPITWVVIAEIFPNRIRGAAVSIAVFGLWSGCLALTLTFPYLNKYLGAHGAFWLYGAVCLLGFFVIRAKLPETKGKSLEQIERELVD
ncbi:MAG: sugar porter family MFS transporter [Sedimentisphaerales bacterium]|nr:sugar porter family MFS transporter [Sedimentisphaerales bacterium]